MKSRIRGLGVLALALGLGMTGCSLGDQLTFPVQQDVTAAADLPFHTASQSYTVVRETPTTGETQSVSAVIDRRGGELKLGGHLLSVPRAAVDRPTLFRMELAGRRNPDGTRSLVIELKATRVENGVEVDVGDRGFAEPLNLKLSYERAVDVRDAEALRVLYLADGTEDGRLHDVGGRVNVRNRFIQAKITHFSKYAVGTGRSDGFE
jgi:hypothetical protein